MTVSKCTGALALLFSLLPAVRAEFSPPYAVLRPEAFAEQLGNDLAWARNNIPLLDFPDADVNRTYYYRWRLFRKHIIQTPSGATLSEFLPGHRSPDQISCAAGHHVAEGTWLRDGRVIDEVLQYWLERAGDRVYEYTHWIGWSAARRQRLLGNRTTALWLLDGLTKIWKQYPSRYLYNVTSTGTSDASAGVGSSTRFPRASCWWQIDDRDGMEFSISGSGCRPTITSSLFGEASAIVELATAVGNTSAARIWGAWRDFSRRALLDTLWNNNTRSFGVVPLPPPPGQVPPVRPPSGFVQAGESVCNLTAVRGAGDDARPADVRELLDLTPLYFSAGKAPLVPRSRAAELAGGTGGMLAQLFDPAGYSAPWGLRTAERRHPCYNYTWDKSGGKKGSANRNVWNAPSWPYETSRVLTGVANLLHEDYPPVLLSDCGTALGAEHFWALLLQYAQQHTRSFCVEDTARPTGSGHVCENLHPDLGYWNTRQWRWQSGMDAAQVDKGSDYFHSSFVDIVISGLLGLRVERGAAGELLLRAAPLLPAALLGRVHYFALDGVRSAAHDIALIYDDDGSRYGRGRGLQLLVDGAVVARRDGLGALNASLPAAQWKPPLPPPPAPTPVPQPGPGWVLLANHTGTFCCDQSACVKGESSFLHNDHEPLASCAARCLADSRCQYITYYDGNENCFNEQYCNATSTYVDTPSPDLVHTWTYEGHK